MLSIGIPGCDVTSFNNVRHRDPSDLSVVLCNGRGLVRYPSGKALTWTSQRMADRSVSGNTAIVTFFETGGAFSAIVPTNDYSAAPGKRLIVEIERGDLLDAKCVWRDQPRIGRRLHKGGPELCNPGLAVCPTCFAAGMMDCDETAHRLIWAGHKLAKPISTDPATFHPATRIRPVAVGDQYLRVVGHPGSCYVERTRVVVVDLGRPAFDEIIVRPVGDAGVLGDRIAIGCARFLNDFERVDTPIALVEPVESRAPRRYGFVRDVGWDPGE